jgi:hypothetical protein
MEINLDPREQAGEVCKAHDRVAHTSSGRLVSALNTDRPRHFKKKPAMKAGKV